MKQNYFSSYHLPLATLENHCLSNSAGACLLHLFLLGKVSVLQSQTTTAANQILHICAGYCCYFWRPTSEVLLFQQMRMRERQSENVELDTASLLPGRFFLKLFFWNFKYVLQIQYSSQPKKIWMKMCCCLKRLFITSMELDICTFSPTHLQNTHIFF